MPGTPDNASSWASLSKRERMIAVRFAEGLTYKQIGEALFIAPATVRAHLAAIYRKLEIHNKIALATLLMDQRLLARARVQEDGAASLKQSVNGVEEYQDRTGRVDEKTKKGRQQSDNGSEVGPVQPLETPATQALLESLGLAQYLPLLKDRESFRLNARSDEALKEKAKAEETVEALQPTQSATLRRERRRRCCQDASMSSKLKLKSIERAADCES